jgi:carbonic anhydrase/acetyltransferase-like protein (isoleucine patch superfamily)
MTAALAMPEFYRSRKSCRSLNNRVGIKDASFLLSDIVLDGAEVGSDSIIGAHTLVTKDTKIPAGSLVIGSPGKVVRSLNAEEIATLPKMAAKYVAVAAHYRNSPEARSNSQ